MNYLSTLISSTAKCVSGYAAIATPTQNLIQALFTNSNTVLPSNALTSAVNSLKSIYSHPYFIKVVDRSRIGLVTFAALFFTSISFAAEKTSEQIDAELNIAYQHLISKSDAYTQDALKKSQRAWLKFRDSQCTLTSGTYGVYSDDEINDLNNCLALQNKNRTDFLKSFNANK